MSKIAFIFPGQGAQACGMGQDFYEQTETGKKIFDKASELLGFSMPELCFEKNDRLDITEYTQAAMVTAGIAMMRVLEEQGIKPDMAAGLSLGEYCALAVSYTHLDVYKRQGEVRGLRCVSRLFKQKFQMTPYEFRNMKRKQE